MNITSLLNYSHPDRIFAIPVRITDDGYCHYLDDTNCQTLSLCGNVRNCTALQLYVRSAQTAITGNVVLTIACKGTTVKTVTLPVTASDLAQTITFDTPVTGPLTITRDTTNAADTLGDDTDKVTAIIGDDIRAVCQ